jgi:hypothetical protein
MRLKLFQDLVLRNWSVCEQRVCEGVAKRQRGVEFSKNAVTPFALRIKVDAEGDELAVNIRRPNVIPGVGFPSTYTILAEPSEHFREPRLHDKPNRNRSLPSVDKRRRWILTRDTFGVPEVVEIMTSTPANRRNK